VFREWNKKKERTKGLIWLRTRKIIRDYAKEKKKNKKDQIKLLKKIMKEILHIKKIKFN